MYLTGLYGHCKNDTRTLQCQVKIIGLPICQISSLVNTQAYWDFVPHQTDTYYLQSTLHDIPEDFNCPYYHCQNFTQCMSSGERENERQRQEDVLCNKIITCSDYTVLTLDNITTRLA